MAFPLGWSLGAGQHYFQEVAKREKQKQGGKQSPCTATTLTHGVRRVRDYHIKGFLILFHELKTISHVQGQLSAGVPHCHPWEVFLRYLDHILQHRDHEQVSGDYKELLLGLLCSCNRKSSAMSHFLPCLQHKSNSLATSRAVSIFSQHATLSPFLRPQGSVTLFVCPCQTQQEELAASKAPRGTTRI